MIVCNLRNLSSPVTGVQRYTQQIVSRFPADKIHVTTPPARWSSGARGHLWEQAALPLQLGGRLLWSPANTGPLSVGHQVLSVMDVSPLDHPERLGPAFAKWYAFMMPRLIRKVRKVITISEFSRSRILHHVPSAAGKICVTPLAADDRFRPEPRGSCRAHERLGLPSQHYLVALGSLEPRKNLKRLFDAWRAVQHRVDKDVWLVIAGEAGKASVFGDNPLGELPPRTHLTGRVDDDMLPALYAGAIASVYVSLYEGFGLPALEAMSCATPVVASNATAIPEVVGDAAVLVDPLDSDSIGDALADIVSDQALRGRLADAALARSRDFSWEKTAAATWAVLNEAAA
jgi:glycosyltransferase involved in cell wall biosynthesis